MRLIQSGLFQFQYGAVKSLTVIAGGLVLMTNFNSSMVRLKASGGTGASDKHYISIPVWCG